jgi:hypothetical protein
LALPMKSLASYFPAAGSWAAAASSASIAAL